MLQEITVGSRLLDGASGVRQPSSKSDYDIICTEEKLTEILNDPQWCTAQVIDGGHPVRKSFVLKHPSGDVLEVELAVKGSVAESLLKVLTQHQVSKIDLAYTLKRSHRFLRNSPHFEKTWKDIQDLRKVGAKIPPELSEWFIDREKETYYYNHPSLNKSKEEFFDTKGVEYIYDHDSIHEAVAIDNEPAYKSFLVGEVKTCKKLFEQQSLDTKLNAVLEEAMVLAIERSLIHIGDPEVKEREVWRYSLMKVCTSITSGWFREFAWEHYGLCCKLYYSRVQGFWYKFQTALNDGKILPHKKGDM
jgi:hypothetical protein